MKYARINKDRLLRVSLLMPVSLTVAMPAFAAIDIGKNTGTWLTDNLNGLIPGIILCVVVVCLIKRDWPKAIGFGAMTLFLAAVMNWDSMKTISASLVKVITGT